MFMKTVEKEKEIIMIIKKIYMENHKSITKIYHFKHKWIKYKLTKLYYEKKGYEIEEYEE